MNNENTNEPQGFIAGIVRAFLTGPLSILLIVFAVIAGTMAIALTPREEEPQIVVPMVDVYVSFPGHSSREVEELVTRPLEKLMWQIDGVEHVYSMSSRDNSMVTVRFYVGQDRDRAMVRIRDKVEGNRDIVPPGVQNWVVKPVEIDDVPIVTLTLTSSVTSASELRRIAEEAEARLASVRNVFRSEIHGGYRREFRVEADQTRMQALGICFGDIFMAISSNNHIADSGRIIEGENSMRILAGNSIKSTTEIARIPIRSIEGRAVYIEDVARVLDTVNEPDWYHHSTYGEASKRDGTGERQQAVTLSFSKKKGTNAVDVAREVIAEAEKLKGKVIPPEIDMIVSRNYGETANDKVNELLSSMLFAILTVVGLMAFTMGWRAAVVVGLSVPVSFALALFINLVAGFTINRVTLFALILSLGLVVDDPITNVDNIQRHLQMGKEPPEKATVTAVMEVIVPVIMSTLAIIVSFTPMFFITGMMGPYMGPMAINVPLTVTFSTVCALTFVPWVGYKLLKSVKAEPGDVNDGVPPWVRRFYRWLISPFLQRRNAILLMIAIFLMLGTSGLLLLFRKVPLKMLPFDNKDELQLIVDMPEGSSLEHTDKAVREFEKFLSRVNEVESIQSYVGIPAPIDFNGLVRHYNLRRKNSNADIRINLAGKSSRKQQSHAIALRLRNDLTAIAEKYKAIVSIVEIPPGPPVFSTLTVEVYGDEDRSYDEIVAGAEFLQQQLKEEDSVHIAQIDNMNETEHDRVIFIPDVQKAAMHGLSATSIQQAMTQAVRGSVVGIAHIDNEREPVLIKIRLPLAERNSLQRLSEIGLRDSSGLLVPLGELGEFKIEKEEQVIQHKNMRPVVFVTAECVGRPPAEIVFDMQDRLQKNPLPPGINVEWAGEGEWEITVRVFRDLGIAFGIALIGIYLLLAVQMNNFVMPLLVMSAIPLTIIGIAPGFYLLNLVAADVVGGYPDPIFFTATAMIGMIALGGIVIRNSVVLIEFIQDSVKQGQTLKESILESGAVRFRPIMLTAATTLLGAWPITLDPIFSGLAWSLIFGLLASTAFTLLVVPTLYYFSQVGRQTATASTTDQEVKS
ncbi:MAG: efflux RND transporter permease subunit [Candidatus Riflebacteria bacterium]|nr:efflux RND transporter permease subunit [Candidatus Riflebacteria bacterium]